MVEIKTKVQPVMVEMNCDNCGAGKMIATGSMRPSNPPKYDHKCSNKECKHKMYYNKEYPVIEYEIQMK